MSRNSGVAWAPVANAGVLGSTIALSADGEKLIVAGNQYVGNPIFSSTDAGANWITNDAPVTNWMSVASSADGSSLAAVVGHASPVGGGIYISQTVPSPELSITPFTNNVLLSWIVPSQPFVLQENTDLSTTNWTDAAVQPVMNYTNLHHEVSVPLSSSNRFYRLKRL